MFGVQVRRHRARLRMTQEGLAARTGLGVRTLRDIEAGRSTPRAHTVDLLADAFRLTGAERADFHHAAEGALADGRTRPGNLPHETSSFVGRGPQLREVARLLATSRLVTLAGVGGVGKTRLARHAAARMPGHPDGVWLADLAPASDPALLGSCIAEALDVSDHGDPDPLAAVLRAIRDRRLLLVLDNCEHLAEPCARVVERLLAGAPRLHVLATSRAPLNLPGEHVLVVPPLSLAAGDDATAGRPAADCEALRLFDERAAAAGRGRAADARSRELALELCRRLDGIPLAIELAAVRLRALALEDLLDRLGFDVLDSPAGHPSRHPSLRAALDWSHGLCTPAEARLWRRLSVFAGSFDLRAAMFVGGDADGGDAPVEALLGLVDKSIVTRQEGGAAARYRLLEPIRQYGAERLVELEDATARRDRHAAWYAGRAQRVEAGCGTARQLAGLRELRSDYPQVRAALEHTLGAGFGPDRAAAGLRLVTSLRSYWIMRSQLGEARRWVDQALAVPLPPGPERDVALWLAAGVAVLQGDAEAAHARLAEGRTAAAAAGDEPALTYLGYVEGAAALVAGDVARARTLLHRAHGPLAALDRPDLMAMSSWFMLPLVELLSGDVQAALTLCKHGCEAAEARGEWWTRSCLHWVAALAHQTAGDVVGGVGEARKALALKLELDDPLGVTITVEQLAWLAGAGGDHLAAATLLGAATRLWSGVGRPWFGFEGLLLLRDRCADDARRELGGDAFESAFRHGGTLDARAAARQALAATA